MHSLSRQTHLHLLTGSGYRTQQHQKQQQQLQRHQQVLRRPCLVPTTSGRRRPFDAFPSTAAPHGPSTSAAAAKTTTSRRFWDDDGSEGSAAQHQGRSNRAWVETEESRVFTHTSFSHKDWRQHRSPKRYFHHLRTVQA